MFQSKGQYKVRYKGRKVAEKVEEKVVEKQTNAVEEERVAVGFKRVLFFL